MRRIKADVNLTRRLFRFGKYVGTVPIFQTEMTALKKFLSMLYLIVLTSLVTILFLLSVWDRTRMYKHMKPLYIIVDFLVIFISFLSIIVSRMKTICNYTIFAKLFKLTTLVEKCLRKLDFKVSQNFVKKLYMRIIGLQIMYGSFLILNIFNRLSTGKSFLIWVMCVPDVITMYNQLYVVNMVTNINYVLTLR